MFLTFLPILSDEHILIKLNGNRIGHAIKNTLQGWAITLDVQSVPISVLAQMEDKLNRYYDLPDSCPNVGQYIDPHLWS